MALAHICRRAAKSVLNESSSRLRAGAVHINGGGIEYGTPFGGYKASGNGREGGLLGLEDYQETKTLHFGWFEAF